MSPALPTFRAALCGLALLALSATPAAATWPHDPYTNVPLCTAAGDQLGIQAISDGAGGAIVVWYDHRNGSNYDIYAQRVSATGVPLWTANGVPVCTAVDDQASAMLTSDGSGGAIVAWHDRRSGTTLDIYAQRLNASGAPQWTNNGVLVAATTGDQAYPVVASDGAGGAIIAFYDTRAGATNHDIYAQRLNPAGSPQWTPNGVPVCTAVSEQYGQQIVADGAGGAIIGWHDLRNGGNDYDIYAQRLNAAGAPQWASNGVDVSPEPGEQSNPAMIADGFGGAILAWIDGRDGVGFAIYAQRVAPSGAALWTAGGVAASSSSGSFSGRRATVASDGDGGAILVFGTFMSNTFFVDMRAQRIAASGVPMWTTDGVWIGSERQSALSLTPPIPDGTGGAIVCWDVDATDVIAQRVSAAGSTLWGGAGTAVAATYGLQQLPIATSDGAGGAILSWQDNRNGNYDVYAQRIERAGKLGSPEPSIVSVRDVPADQGGAVKLSWNASYLDVDPTYEVGYYRIWRSSPPSAAAALRAAGGMGATDDPDLAFRSHLPLRTTVAAATYYWESVAITNAAGLPGYSYTASTAADSVGGSNPRTAFMVEALSSLTPGTDHWFSAPDSGYSVDNLPPAAPAHFQGQYGGSQTWLSWDPSPEPDLSGYRLYRGSDPSFVPDPANRIATPSTPGWVDAAGTPYYYKLSAVDVHGNESLPASLLPSGSAAVGDGKLPLELALAVPAPNPLRAGAGAVFRLALPRGAAVRLVICDAAGREVRRLIDAALPAGEHPLHWDARDGAGRRVSPGLYLARAMVGDQIRQVRAVVLE